MEPTATEAMPASPQTDYVYPFERRTVVSSTLLTPGSGRSGFKTVLWISLGLTALFVFITSEALLVTDYPMYHAYRLQVIADRHLLIPHSLCGVIALLAGPVQFSSRFRRRHLSMRLADITYSHSAVWPYLWNLLPENPNVLQRWGQQFHVSSSSPFKLLKFVGADVPGAAQFLPPAAFEAVRASTHPRSIGSAWMNSRNGSRNCDPMVPLCAALVTAAK